MAPTVTIGEVEVLGDSPVSLEVRLSHMAAATITKGKIEVLGGFHCH